MFEQNGMIEAQNGEIQIIDCSVECFRAMIEYFYSGEIDKNILKNFAEELFSIAHKYEVITLMEICEKFMILNIDNTNLIKRCHCVELYNPTKLEEACIKYINDNRTTFLESNGMEGIKSE
uniref:BTB domain-containing protein n=1 Tax=Meloidogyne hapla TaxID=6305 RepID=A0A1I8AXW5_MELHA